MNHDLKLAALEGEHEVLKDQFAESLRHLEGAANILSCSGRTMPEPLPCTCQPCMVGTNIKSFLKLYKKE